MKRIARIGLGVVCLGLSACGVSVSGPGTSGSTEGTGGSTEGTSGAGGSSGVVADLPCGVACDVGSLCWVIGDPCDDPFNTCMFSPAACISTPTCDCLMANGGSEGYPAFSCTTDASGAVTLVNGSDNGSETCTH